ncbi:hypothetical protein CC78DRAFT_538088 [Lojkania enalia]|uniref:Uncharacterized protein n=1 Tax=Lojkania enalia TaxID=147567 RepID=A0A9P4MY07_9PLEO|nr:hypothetical protein CC78DRAFT_538088 [Didymosphaeria enalia]
MFGNASTYFISSHVFCAVAIVALLVVCFAFSLVFLFGFWPTFLAALLSFLTLLSFTLDRARH